MGGLSSDGQGMTWELGVLRCTMVLKKKYLGSVRNVGMLVMSCLHGLSTEGAHDKTQVTRASGDLSLA